jgi:hypothetical protein
LSALLAGCDFSSSPSRRKPIVFATGSLERGRVQLSGLETAETLAGSNRTGPGSAVSISLLGCRVN